jgi:hypothetical protein
LLLLFLLNAGLDDGSEESVAWLVLYDGSEESVAWRYEGSEESVAWLGVYDAQRLSLGFDDGAEAVAWLEVCCTTLGGCRLACLVRRLGGVCRLACLG